MWSTKTLFTRAFSSKKDDINKKRSKEKGIHDGGEQKGHEEKEKEKNDLNKRFERYSY